jgi:hypothetical protein
MERIVFFGSTAHQSNVALADAIKRTEQFYDTPTPIGVCLFGQHTLGSFNVQIKEYYSETLHYHMSLNECIIFCSIGKNLV